MAKMNKACFGAGTLQAQDTGSDRLVFSNDIRLTPRNRKKALFNLVSTWCLCGLAKSECLRLVLGLMHL